MLTSMYFPNREELLLRKVLALPKLSSSGLESRIWFSMLGPMRLAVLPQIVEMNCKIFLVASVLPAPDSPMSKMRTVSHPHCESTGADVIPEINTD